MSRPYEFVRGVRMVDTISSLMEERHDLVAQMRVLQERLDENEKDIKDLHQGDDKNDYESGGAQVKKVTQQNFLISIKMDKGVLDTKVTALKAVTG